MCEDGSPFFYSCNGPVDLVFSYNETLLIHDAVVSSGFPPRFFSFGYYKIVKLPAIYVVRRFIGGETLLGWTKLFLP